MSVTFYADRARTQVGFAVSCYGYGAHAGFRGPVMDCADAARALHDADHPRLVREDLEALEAEAAVAHGDRLEVVRARLDLQYSCDFDGFVSPVFDTDADPSVNMSNVNAARVLGLLGVNDDPEFGLCGSMPAEEFLGAVLIASALTPSDTGVPALVDAAPGRATFIDVGRPEGYLQERLEQLVRVGEFARAHGAQVVWG